MLSAALVLLAGLVTSVIYLSRPQGPPAPEELDKPVMAAQIEFMADAMQRSAARIAAHPQTLACFAGAVAEVCQAQAANLHALNQDATVLFVTDGQRQLLPGFLPGDKIWSGSLPPSSRQKTPPAAGFRERGWDYR